jgi:LruC domain-containing protein
MKHGTELLLALSTGILLSSCQPTNPRLGPGPQAPAKILAAQAEPTPTPQPVAKFPQTSSDVAAVAFEDMSPTRNDEDFNDFLTDFKIFEKINEDNQVTNIVIDFYPRAVGASYDHEFLMVLNGVKDTPTDVKTPKLPPLVNGPADVELTYYGGTGTEPMAPATKVSSDHDIVIFPSTHGIFVDNPKSRQIINTDPKKPYIAPRMRARLSITLLDPTQNAIDPQNPIDLSKFRMMLHVKDTNRDIDIIDVDPTNFDQNKKDQLYYPFGFIIPDNWHWPSEGTPITQAYPSFQAYNQFLHGRLTNPTLKASDDVAHWYNAKPVADTVYLNQGNPIPPPELLPEPW